LGRGRARRRGEGCGRCAGGFLEEVVENVNVLFLLPLQLVNLSVLQIVLAREGKESRERRRLARFRAVVVLHREAEVAFEDRFDDSKLSLGDDLVSDLEVGANVVAGRSEEEAMRRELCGGEAGSFGALSSSIVIAWVERPSRRRRYWSRSRSRCVWGGSALEVEIEVGGIGFESSASNALENN
jgi:hypothetical protein